MKTEIQLDDICNELKAAARRFAYECGKEAYRESIPIDMGPDLGWTGDHLIAWEIGWNFELYSESERNSKDKGNLVQ
jgi:hypothetical protein